MNRLPLQILTRLLDLVVWVIALLALVALFSALVQAQEPDQRGEAILPPPPVYQGQRAVPIVPPDTVRNEGGSDGAGLCVIASLLANGIYQGVPGLAIDGPDGHRGHGSAFWQAAKSRPGGYYPEKLSKFVNETNPGEKWASYYGPNRDVLDTVSRQGIPVGATMSTGRQYGYQRIAHMISLLFYRKGGSACVLDNNFPDVYSWMPASEFDRRWVDDGTNGWAWWWLRKPVQKATGTILLVAAVVVAVVVVAAKRLAGGDDE